VGQGWKIGGAVTYGAVPVLVWAAVAASQAASDPSVASNPLVPNMWEFPLLLFVVLPLCWTTIAVVLAVRAARHPR
jgi:hypothetical protein